MTLCASGMQQPARSGLNTGSIRSGSRLSRSAPPLMVGYFSRPRALMM